MSAIAEVLPKTARASVVTKWGEELEVREYPLSLPEPGSLLVRVDRATVCGSDVHAWRGGLNHLRDIRLPIILGHEIVGIVVARGDGAEFDSVGNPLTIGDRVIWAHEACGHCYQCSVVRSGMLCTNRRVGFVSNADEPPHLFGGFAEYAYVWPRSDRLRVPDEIKSEWASASSCALRSVITAVNRVGIIDYRHTVIVQGDGPLGLFATAVLSTHSPRQIIVIGGSAQRLAVAREWGADVTISVEESPSVEERRGIVQDTTNGNGGDVVAEFSGAPGAFAEGVALAAPNGRYVIPGTVSGPEQPILADDINLKNLIVYGSPSAEIDGYYHALDFMAQMSDRFDWDRMISSKVHPLNQATDALRRMAAYEDIKAVIDPSLA